MNDKSHIAGIATGLPCHLKLCNYTLD